MQKYADKNLDYRLVFKSAFDVLRGGIEGLSYWFFLPSNVRQVKEDDMEPSSPYLPTKLAIGAALSGYQIASTIFGFGESPTDLVSNAGLEGYFIGAFAATNSASGLYEILRAKLASRLNNSLESKIKS